MNILRELAGGLLKMFVGDAWLTVGILSVVSLTALLTGSGVVRPLLRRPWLAERPLAGIAAVSP